VVISCVGKYVCYGRGDGKFCFGRIVAQTRVNSTDGERDAFVLEDRLCGPHGERPADGEAHKRDPRMVPNVTKVGGRTLLRMDKIDLGKDVFERRPGMETLTDEQLFLAVLKGELDGEDADGVPLGVANMLAAQKGEGFEEMAKAEMRKRTGQKA